MNNHIIARVLLCAVLLGACATSPVQAAERFEPTMQLRGARVHLNGSGIRWRGPFKVYSAELYLSRRASTPEEILGGGGVGAMRLSLTMLRDIDAAEMGKLFVRGVEDNMDRASFSRLIPGLLRMSQIFSENKKLAKGDNVMIDWIPGTGMVISINDVPQGLPFKDAEFHAAMMRIWLGHAPVDWRLKENLLGREA